MPTSIRIFLILGAVVTTYYFGMQVKKGKVEIQHSLFWLLFSLFLVLASIFPSGIIFIAKQLHFQSPANFLFLMIIFVLFLKEFLLTIQLSKLEERHKNLTQKIALTSFEATTKTAQDCEENA